MQSDDRFHEDGLAGTGLTNNHIDLTVIHFGRDMVEDDIAVKNLHNIFEGNHRSSLVSTKSANSMMMDELTTAEVEALPTSSAPPRTE